MTTAAVVVIGAVLAVLAGWAVTGAAAVDIGFRAVADPVVTARRLTGVAGADAARTIGPVAAFQARIAAANLAGRAVAGSTDTSLAVLAIGVTAAAFASVVAPAIPRLALSRFS